MCRCSSCHAITSGRRRRSTPALTHRSSLRPETSGSETLEQQRSTRHDSSSDLNVDLRPCTTSEDTIPRTCKAFIRLWRQSIP